MYMMTHLARFEFSDEDKNCSLFNLIYIYINFKWILQK